MKLILKLLLLICTFFVNAQTYETESYGQHPQQLYDIYEAENVEESTPVLIFLHGGGWWAEHRQRDYYRPFINDFHATHSDLVLVNADYRLLVEGTTNSVIYDQIDDVVSVINKVRESYPNNPIYLFGNSAGGHLAMWTYFNQEELEIDIKGVIPIATPYSGENGYWESGLANWQQEVFVSSEVDLQGLTPNQYASPRTWHSQELDNILYFYMSGDPYENHLGYLLEDYPSLEYVVYETWHSGWLSQSFREGLIQKTYDFVTMDNLSIAEIQPNEKPLKVEYLDIHAVSKCKSVNSRDCFLTLNRGLYIVKEIYANNKFKTYKIIKK